MKSGKHFLQIPGPSPIPDRVLSAMHRPAVDHRGPAFGKFVAGVLQDIKPIFKTIQPVLMYPASGSGAWESALVNTLSPGDQVLMYETGQFATLWKDMASKLGLDVIWLEGDWRSGIDLDTVSAKLAADSGNKIKAVCAVHNDTSTGITSDIAGLRATMDAVDHPALLLVDTISSLGSMEYRHDEWRVDVTIGGSQKGLQLPPGLSFTAVSEKAVAASKTAKMTRWYWDWTPYLAGYDIGSFPYTPATSLIYGLRESIDMIMEEGMDNIFARHARLGEATRKAVAAWGLETQCSNPAHLSNSVTAVRMPEGHDADAMRNGVLDDFDMSLGGGLNKVAGRVFRIGHLGSTNDLTLLGALSGVEMGLKRAGVPHQAGGVDAAMAFLST